MDYQLLKEAFKKYCPMTITVSGIACMIQANILYGHRLVQLESARRKANDGLKKYRRRAVSNNYLKLHHEPKRRRWGS